MRYVAVLARRNAHVWTPDEILIAETLANQAALGLARIESERRRVVQAERDHALARAAHALNVSLELQAVLDTLAREADLAVGGEMAGVYLLDVDGTALATAGHNCPDEWFGYRLAPGEGIAGQVLATGRPVMTSDYDDDMTLPGNVVPPGVRSGVGVPMRWNGELRGALSVGFLDRRAVTRDDLGVLEAIADLAVVACHNAEAYDDVRTAASTDALTGLLNHGAMQVRVREEIARAARDSQPLCCVLIDLDDFKRVNDELGHPAGDALLRRVADALRAEVRPYDQVARYGGDEFVLVLPGTEAPTARAIAERVRQRVRTGSPRSAGGGAIGRLLDRRLVVGAADGRRRPARRRRPRAAAGQADRQGPRRRREPGRRGGARAAAALRRVARRRAGARRRDRGARQLHARSTPTRSCGSPPASRCCSA